MYEGGKKKFKKDSAVKSLTIKQRRKSLHENSSLFENEYISKLL